jgi:hypothetical protein
MTGDVLVISVNAIRIAIFSYCVPSSVVIRLSFEGEDKLKPSPENKCDLNING